jgi:hypothetical protein
LADALENALQNTEIQESKVKSRNEQLLVFALSSCTFIFAFCILAELSEASIPVLGI